MYKCTNVTKIINYILYNINKIDINQNNSLLFGLLTENVYNFIVFQKEDQSDYYAAPLRHTLSTATTHTLHRYYTNTAPLARMICTAFTSFVLREA